ncbi:prestin-like isoform X2 [Cylas formicarius]|uniref:prestin-like isoform X2 n=1 Tax=Cylas formicarius TaxID=197179 RepID=UPI0029587656|nr:prestin-like isoform X2 [Cylas formicarius]
MEAEDCHIRIDRPYYEHRKLREDFYYEKPKKANAAKEWSENFRPKKFIVSVFPVFEWIFKYNWKKDIAPDIIAGFTVAIMHIPQGMAYAMLGNVPAIVGIYMAFFPVLVYFFFGTSRHNSLGTFSVACLMTGKAVIEHSDPSYFANSPEISNGTMTGEPTGYSPVQVATAVTFIVALFQIAMYVLRLGIVSALLSETLVSGFTTGAAIHVLVSQIKDLLGLSIPKFKGNFVNIYTMIAVFERISSVNVAALIISAVTIFTSVINNDYLKPIVAKKSPIPFPMELVAVVVGTVVSKYCYLVDSYGIKVVGDIPVGIPEPHLPPFGLMSSMVVDGITIAIVSYTINLSMALIFAQKLDYEVDANQELLAMGAGNIVGSFFSCMPVCASLSRSLIQQVVGGVSQIASIVSCAILLAVLLWIGPFFELLPKAVLASVIVVALKGMLLQTLDFLKFWKLSRIDALVWATTFLSVVFIGIDIGLGIGIAMSLFTIFVLSFRPYTCLLGEVPNTDFYLDITRYKGAKEIKGMKIFHYSGGLNFATKSIFKADLIRLVGVNPQKEVIYRAKLAKYLDRAEEKSKKSLSTKLERVQHKVNTDLRCLILDFSSVSYIDPSGVTMLKSIIESFMKLSVPVYIAGSKEHVYEMLTKCDPEYCKNLGFRLFPTVYDAHHYSTEIFRTSSNSSISTIKI